MSSTEENDRISSENPLISEWQINLGLIALESIASGTAELMEWDEAKKQFKL